MKKAVALKYRDDLPAPFLAAKGRGVTAHRILELAEASGVPIQQHQTIVDPLFDLDIGNFIPEEYFEIVAEILSLVYTLPTENRQKT
jgi:type III secretion system FlhB-like substrate exporter